MRRNVVEATARPMRCFYLLFSFISILRLDFHFHFLFCAFRLCKLTSFFVCPHSSLSLAASQSLTILLSASRCVDHHTPALFGYPSFRSIFDLKPVYTTNPL
jgi:hypothetical protein